MAVLRSSWLKFTIFLLLCSCSRHPENHAQGYIEGRYTYMATSVSGALNSLMVQRGQYVKKGDVLYVLQEKPESDIYKASLDDLKQVSSARDAIAANLTFAKLTFDRYQVLVPKHAISQADLDNAQSIFNSTNAQLSQANANIAKATAALAQSKWTVEQKVGYAPVDGLVFDTYYRTGEYTVENQPILSLLAPADIKAIFYVNEPALGLLKLGDKVKVECDRCEKAYEGTISFISPTAEYTPPVIYSNETNEKLIFRIEAEFAAKDAFHLHPGQPVYVTYQHHDR